MAASTLHRFEQGGKRFVVDTETCFCFECDEISWAVLEHYPHTPVNRILHLVGQSHPVREIEEVIGELEWLRSTKSILPVLGPKEQLKRYESTGSLCRVDVFVAEHGSAALVAGAMALLLGRSVSNKNLVLAVHCQEAAPADKLAYALDAAYRNAGLAAKALSVEVHIPVSPRGKDARACAGHAISLYAPLARGRTLEDLRAFEQACRKPLSQVATTIAGAAATLTPGSGEFSGALAYLHQAGFTRIDIDLPGAYQQNPGLDPEAMLAGMHAAAVYYAGQLHGGNYYRLEPVASTFHQIYEGEARPRSDGSGTSELAIDANGDIFPSRQLLGQPDYLLGNVANGTLDEARRAPFDDLGALTTSPCSLCYARNLCGGGHSAIHAARAGGIRAPEAAWCESQREWFASAIAAFNLLAAHGVNFSRLYATMQTRKKPSLWQAAKMAVTMKAGLRPIEEADAPMLTRWENWSDAIYFLGNEYGMFLATQYDREMDSLHPRGIEQEMVIVSRRGEPLGLLKIRPDGRAGLARIWVYFRDARDYADAGLRKSFVRLLAEAAKQETFGALIAAVGPGDAGLGEFLLATGFEHAGTERQALFLHDAYHDVDLYRTELA